MYSLRNNDSLAPFKSSLKYENHWRAIRRSTYSGPAFGGDCDLHIVDNAGSNTNSHTNFGHIYNLPPGYTYGQTNTRSLLGGSYYFTPSEVEVLYLN